MIKNRRFLKHFLIVILLISLFSMPYLAPVLKDYYNGVHLGVYGIEPWQIQFPAKQSLQGYASMVSVQPGQLIRFYIHSTLPFDVTFFRTGYYQGSGAILKCKQGPFPPQIQKVTLNTTTMAANWKETFSFHVPQDWKTGFYLGKLTNSQGKSSYIPFVVHEKHPQADFAIMLSTNTYQAYNNWGGKSLYAYSSKNRQPSYSLSFDRTFERENGAGDFFQYEYHFIRWLERKGYRITYLTDTDVHQGILERSSIKALLIPGHSEYWSKNMRDQIEKHVHRGMNLGLFCANTAYWQIRLEQKARKLVCYRMAERDPLFKTNPDQVTTRFRSAHINRPEDHLLGVMYQGIPNRTSVPYYPLVVSNPNHWMFEGTTLRKGDVIQGLIGGEIDNNMRKLKNVQVITRSPVTIKGLPRPLEDTKPQYDNNQVHTFSDMVWAQQPGGGGKIFSTGTFRWSLYLEPFQDMEATFQRNIEIMTMNVLKRLQD